MVWTGTAQAGVAQAGDVPVAPRDRWPHLVWDEIGARIDLNGVLQSVSYSATGNHVDYREGAHPSWVWTQILGTC